VFRALQVEKPSASLITNPSNSRRNMGTPEMRVSWDSGETLPGIRRL